MEQLNTPSWQIAVLSCTLTQKLVLASPLTAVLLLPIEETCRRKSSGDPGRVTLSLCSCGGLITVFHKHRCPWFPMGVLGGWVWEGGIQNLQCKQQVEDWVDQAEGREHTTPSCSAMWLVWTANFNPTAISSDLVSSSNGCIISPNRMSLKSECG